MQSSNFAAEYGSGGVNVSAVTKSGASRFHGAAIGTGATTGGRPTTGPTPLRVSRSRRAATSIRAATWAGPSPLPGSDYNKGRDKLFFWFGLEVQRQNVDTGSHLSTTMSQAARTGDLSEFLANRGQNLNHPVFVNIPGRLPGEGHPRRTTTCRRTSRRSGGPWRISTRSRTTQIRTIATTTCSASPYPINRVESKMRFDWNISSATKAYVRLALDAERRFPAGRVGRQLELELAHRVSARDLGRSFAANRRADVEPDDDE